jgi:leader peptidase (prepilin peptidase)/N-methyltransferase
MADMTTINMGRLLPIPTSTIERVAAAWADSHPVARRAAVAAAITSTALGGAVAAPAPQGIAVGVTGVVLAVAALVDTVEEKLPNRLLALAAYVTIVGTLPSWREGAVVACVLGGLIAVLLLGIVLLARGVGMGDVKMAAVVGMSAGSLWLVAAPAAIAVAALVAGGYGVLSGRSRLVLGPSLWLGWMVAIAAAIWRW